MIRSCRSRLVLRFSNVVFRCEFCASEFQPPITGHWSSMEMYFHFLRCLWCTEHSCASQVMNKIIHEDSRHYKETCDEAEGGIPEGRDEDIRR